MCLNIEIKDFGNYIQIEPLHRLYSGSELDWDKNWISAKITVAAGAFNGTYIADLTTFDFKNFNHDLHNLYDNLNGSLEVRDLEGYVKLVIKGDGIGHFNLRAICCDRPGLDSAELRFELSFDQTFIRPMVNSLKQITEKFPIIGDY